MTVNGKEFEVLCLLGKGKGGYSYLVTDGESRFVIKQIHHEPCDYYQFGDKLASELRDYDTLRRVCIPMPALLEVDHANERILKEYIDGPTIAALVEVGNMQPSYLQQMHAMCEQLYPNGLNIDYYPTNFVVQEGKLFYIDYECNVYDPKWDFANWGRQYWG